MSKQDVIMKAHDALTDYYCREEWKIDRERMTVSQQFFINKEVKKITRLIFDPISFGKLKEIFVEAS